MVPPQTYEALADPNGRGRVCIRSSSNVYNLSADGPIIAHDGAAAAEDRAPAKAHPPEGGPAWGWHGLRGPISRWPFHLLLPALAESRPT